MPKAAHSSLDAGKLVISLIEILSSGNAMAIHFERLVQDQGIGEGAPAVTLLSGIKKILRDLPDKAFADSKHRLALVDAVQDALDTAIEAEEATLEPATDEHQDDEQRQRKVKQQVTGGNH